MIKSELKTGDAVFVLDSFSQEVVKTTIAKLPVKKTPSLYAVKRVGEIKYVLSSNIFKRKDAAVSAYIKQLTFNDLTIKPKKKK